MLQDNDVDLSKLVRVTSAGIQTASFVQIRAALIAKYQEVYGTDIDLSTGTADGVFVNDLALIINNMLQGIQILASNLDVNTASGVYLDNLCALSNVTRKEATYSSTSLEVTNSGTSSVEYSELTFVDQSGIEWTWSADAGSSLTWAAGETKELTVKCSESGKVKAPAGWINQTLEVTYLTVEQPNDASVGSTEETDASLRARRAQSSGAAGVTVLESLQGALLNLAGVDDVKIYNNNSGSSISSQDGTTVDAHSIYVIIKKQAGVTIEDSTIGSIIHEKLTPGIHSCDSSGTQGTAKSYQYISSVYGVTIDESTQYVYWKEATPINPTITIVIDTQSYFTESEFDTMGQAIISYMNDLHIGETTTSTNLLIEAVSADPKYKGKATYTVNSASVSDANSDTYYNYTTIAYTKDSSVSGRYTLTIS